MVWSSLAKILRLFNSCHRPSWPNAFATNSLGICWRCIPPCPLTCVLVVRSLVCRRPLSRSPILANVSSTWLYSTVTPPTFLGAFAFGLRSLIHKPLLPPLRPCNWFSTVSQQMLHVITGIRQSLSTSRGNEPFHSQVGVSCLDKRFGPLRVCVPAVSLGRCSLGLISISHVELGTFGIVNILERFISSLALKGRARGPPLPQMFCWPVFREVFSTSLLLSVSSDFHCLRAVALGLTRVSVSVKCEFVIRGLTLRSECDVGGTPVAFEFTHSTQLHSFSGVDVRDRARELRVNPVVNATENWRFHVCDLYARNSLFFIPCFAAPTSLLGEARSELATLLTIRCFSTLHLAPLSLS